MTELLASPAAARLGWVCIHSLWQAAAVAAALAVALRLIPRQSAGTLAARYRLAATALAALPVAAVVTFFLVPVARPAGAPLPARADTAASTPATPTAASTAAATTPRFVLLPAAPLGAPQPTRPDHLDRLAAWLPLVALAWTVGAALAAIRMACGVWITRRLVARATSDSSRQLQHRVDHWRRIMRIEAAVRILASAAVETPVVVGWLKPVILWPAAATPS
jgi:beta-lactamase regulating signal transducer with metallopeptidase domain